MSYAQVMRFAVFADPGEIHMRLCETTFDLASQGLTVIEDDSLLGSEISMGI